MQSRISGSLEHPTREHAVGMAKDATVKRSAPLITPKPTATTFLVHKDDNKTQGVILCSDVCQEIRLSSPSHKYNSFFLIEMQLPIKKG